MRHGDRASEIRFGTGVVALGQAVLAGNGQEIAFECGLPERLGAGQGAVGSLPMKS